MTYGGKNIWAVPVTGKLSGRTAIVTGASRGIGRADALRLAREGADVAIVARRLDSFRDYQGDRDAMTADSVVEEIRALGVRALGFEGDVSDPATMKGIVEEVVGSWGTLDILVNNAGGASYPPAEQATPSAVPSENVSLDLGNNLLSTVHGCQAAAPIMMRQGRGAIINVSSQAAKMPIGHAISHYAASKAAVEAYSRYLTEEVGPFGVRVNVISPGYISTGRLKDWQQSLGNRLLDTIALRRVGLPEECASVVAFLAGDDSSYITGQVISVCGGPYAFGVPPEPTDGG